MSAPPRIDAHGTHCQQHGNAALLLRRFPSLPRGLLPSLHVYSWREPKTHSGAATVVLSVSEEPFTFTGHLAPEHARALAANLLAAADQAERAQALLDARAARAAARAEVAA